MLIKSIEIKDFRSIRDQRLDCDNLTALVGRNGSGKSSFLYAIEVFYDVAAPISIEDFFERDPNSVIEIRVTYGDLREEEKDEFRPYIKDEKLIVTKKISFRDGRIDQKYYAAALQIPQFAEIRAIGAKREKTRAWKELADKGELPGLEGKVGKADDIDPLMESYEKTHPGLYYSRASRSREKGWEALRWRN